jgi:hypothetical protein
MIERAAELEEWVGTLTPKQVRAYASQLKIKTWRTEESIEKLKREVVAAKYASLTEGVE